MAALASSDVTVTLQANQKGKLYERTSNGGRRVLVKIAFGDGALTYPSGGVPLPAAASFGFKSHMTALKLLDEDDASGIAWKYDYENKKLRAYLQGIVVSAAGGATMDDFALDTTSDPLSTAVAVSLTNSTGAGTKYLGKMKEMATTQAPAAQVLYAEAIGI